MTPARLGQLLRLALFTSADRKPYHAVDVLGDEASGAIRQSYLTSPWMIAAESKLAVCSFGSPRWVGRARNITGDRKTSRIVGRGRLGVYVAVEDVVPMPPGAGARATHRVDYLAHQYGRRRAVENVAHRDFAEIEQYAVQVSHVVVIVVSCGVAGAAIVM